MEQQIYEGTWEEINTQLAAHQEELRRYRRVRLIVVPQEGPMETQNETKQQTLAERFAGRIGRLSFEPADLSERTKEAYAELLAKEYAEKQK